MKKHFREMIYGITGQRKIGRLEIVTEDLLQLVSHNRKALLSLITLLALLVISIGFIIHFAIFLINDVVLFRKEITVNDTGAFMQSKACDSEQAMYLFNTSELWANTGIQVRKGDRMKLSASGAFNTSIQSVEKGARTNKLPKYAWSSVGSMSDTIPAEWDNNVLSLFPPSQFGTVLYQIRNDAEPLQSDWTAYYPEVINPDDMKDEVFRGEVEKTLSDNMAIRKMTNTEDYIDVDKDGTIYVAINDIYFNDALIRKFEKENLDILSHQPGLQTVEITDSLKGKNILVPRSQKRLFPLYYLPVNDPLAGDSLVYVAGPAFVDFFRQNRDVWYNDNVGQIAVTAEIQHQISNWPVNSAGWYRIVETQVMNVRTNPWNILWLFLEFVIVVPLLFILFYAVTTCIIYYGLYFLLWSWDRISDFYRHLSRLLLSRLRR